jgi:hypothetical protein
MCDEHSKTGDPAVGSTRLLGRWQSFWLGCIDGIIACMILRILTVEEWRYRLMITCLLIGTMGCGIIANAMRPNAAGEPQPRKPRT